MPAKTDSFRGESEIATQHLATLRRQLDLHPDQQGAPHPALEGLAAALLALRQAYGEVAQQNEACTARCQDLERELTYYRDVFEHAPHAHLMTDLSGAIQVANAPASTLLQASQGSLAGQQLAAFLPEQDRQAFCLHLAQLQTGGVLQDWEVHLQPASGDPVPISLDAMPVHDLEHRLVGFQWLLRDISRQAQAEEALRQSEGRYRLLVESLHDGVWLLDKDDYTTFANPRMAEMLGYTVDEMLGCHLFSFVGEEQLHLARARMARRRQGIKEAVDFEFRRKDGTLLYANVEVTPLFDDRGQYAGALAGIADMTERRRADEERERLLARATRDSQRAEELAATVQRERDTLQTVMESTRAQVAYLDPHFNFLLVNTAYAEGSRHAKEELLGRNHFDLFPNPENQGIFERVRDTGQPAEYPAKPFEFADQPERGVTYWDWSLVPVKSNTGQVQGLVLSLLDVTQRVRDGQYVDSLRAQAQRQADEMAAVFSALVEPMMVFDAQGAIQQANPAAVEALGIDPVGLPEAVLGQKVGVRDLDGHPIPDGDLVAVRALRGERVRGEYQTLTTADGDERDIVASSAPIVTGARISGAVVTWHDISDLRRTEAALRESEAKLRTLFELMPVGVSILDQERRITSHNAALARILGLSHDELLQGNYTARTYLRSDGTVMPPDEFPSARAFRERMLVHDQVGIVKEDETVIWVDISAAPVPFADWRVVTATVDVTERRQIEQALRQARDQLELRVRERTAELASANEVLLVEISERMRIEEELRAGEEKLERRVEERTRELRTLLDISNTVALTLELEPLLALILERLKDVVDYDGATAARLQAGALSPVAHRGAIPPDVVLHLGSLLEEAVLGRAVISSSEPLILRDVQREPALERSFREAAGDRFEAMSKPIRAWMALPVTIKKQVYGVLYLYHDQPGRYTEEHARLALAFGNQAAVAIENARLYEQAQALAALEERQRLARELHDAVTQTLFSASLAAEVLPRLWERNQEAGLRCLSEVHQLTRGALAEMRTLLLELRPAALVETELGALLRQLAEAVTSRARIPVTVLAAPHCTLPPEVQVALYRIAQEALNNAAKHADAQHVEVDLQCVPPCPSEEGRPSTTAVELCVADDGCGFDPGLLPSGSQGLGLGIMRERAAGVGAAFRIQSQPRQGTRITVIWPEEA